MKTARPLVLPEPPADLVGRKVKTWSSPVVIPTYRPMPADRNPMFLERRVYQGSSGRVYPLPFIDRIAEERVDQSWEAIHIENEYLRLMILPQLGGRIHVARDKTNGYDFIYRQDVIKPALVGLAGPWISGGIEFNWPQHHRPSTFMPADVHIQSHADGSVTVWCSEHEPMNRMKGMHGVCLHPGRSVIELKVRLYNRTPLTQTFLWWANVAARVHERYQSFFPPDVYCVADHAKRATSRFPRCGGKYYGVDYAARGREGVPEHEMPRQFVPPPGEYPPDDLSWYANIPVPTSYMCMSTRADFFGGYDHAARAGIVHVASHHISPGKKQWTWGNHEFGCTWDRNLTDPDEHGVHHPYIELMAGVFTDNQPDFAFLAPGETRTFSQFWYPIREIGPAHLANQRAAVSLVMEEDRARVGVAVTAPITGAQVTLERGGQPLARWTADLAPDRPLVHRVELPVGCEMTKFRLAVMEGSKEIISYCPPDPNTSEVPPAATEPPLPRDVATTDELYLTGLHLAQYRHATRAPEAYWREALQRDPDDARCSNAMGLWHLRRGEFEQAAESFQRAIRRLTRRNPNPLDGEPFYNLGLALRFAGRDDEAYDAFYKATWNYSWQSAAFFALAELDCRRQHWATALDQLDRVLRVNTEHLQARDLKAIVLRKLGRDVEAEKLLRQTLELDPLDFSARFVSGAALDCNNQIRLDLATDFTRAGLAAEAIEVLRGADMSAGDGTLPIVHYGLAWLHDRLGSASAAAAARAAATGADPSYCFPSRVEEINILRAAIDADPRDARAPYYLGNMLYDRRRHEEAIELWERAAHLDPGFAIVWRNLAIGYYNIRRNVDAARAAYEAARRADPHDARLLYEQDQLWKRSGESPAERLAELERRLDLVHRRDDLCIELASLYNQTGQHERAAELLAGRRFQPWEGGEGQALGEHARTQLALGRRALHAGDTDGARQHFKAALQAPENLGEAKHLLTNQSDVHYWLGMAASQAGEHETARRHLTVAADRRGDFQEMSVRPFSEMTYYSALALRALGREAEAQAVLVGLLAHARGRAAEPAKIDYFATSLPALLLFEDDLDHRQRTRAMFLQAQALIGLGNLAAGRSLLEAVLAADPNHALAADLLSEETGDRLRARAAAKAPGEREQHSRWQGE